MYHMGLHDGERNIVLAEYIGDGELAAVSIPAMLEIHLADLVRIGLHQNGNARVLQGSDGTVFIRKDGHGENHTVILAFMLFQPFGIEAALFAGFHTAVTGQFRVHGDVVIARIRDSLDHILTGTIDQFAGHEATVAEAKGNGELFGYYECEKGVAYAEKVQAESPVVDRWNDYMKDILELEMDPETGAQPKLEQVFRLD